MHVSGLVIEGEPAHAEASGFTGLAIHGSEDVVVDDVEVRQVGGTGLALWGDNARVTLRRVHVHGVRSGAGISIGCGDASCWTRDSVLENNLVHDVRGERRPGIELLRGGQGNALVDNVVHAVTGVGIAVSSAEYGAANEVRGNVVFGATDSGIRVEGAAVVRNNLVFEIDGVGLRATDRFADALSDVVIAHNTVVGTSDWGIRVDGWAGRDGMVLANNAVSNPLGMAFHVDEGELDAGNRVVGNVMTGLVEGLDPALGQVRAGAGHDDFVDVDGWDLYPSETSTLLAAADADAGSWVPEDDFSGYARDGLAPDVGAYEYVGAGNPGWPVQEGFKEAAAPRVDGEELGGCGKGGEAGALLGPALALLGRRRRRDQPSSGR